MVNKKVLQITKDLLENSDYIHPNTAIQLIETIELMEVIIKKCQDECNNDNYWADCLDNINEETSKFFEAFNKE
jgi:hypothetical protein